MQSKLAKLGMVCRDSNGEICCCAAARRFNVLSPLQAELMAIRFGLEIAITNGLVEFQIEIDSMLAVQEVQKGYHPVNGVVLSLIFVI